MTDRENDPPKRIAVVEAAIRSELLWAARNNCEKALYAMIFRNLIRFVDMQCWFDSTIFQRRPFRSDHYL